MLRPKFVNRLRHQRDEQEVSVLTISVNGGCPEPQAHRHLVLALQPSDTFLDRPHERPESEPDDCANDTDYVERIMFEKAHMDSACLSSMRSTRV